MSCTELISISQFIVKKILLKTVALAAVIFRALKIVQTSLTPVYVFFPPDYKLYLLHSARDRSVAASKGITVGGGGGGGGREYETFVAECCVMETITWLMTNHLNYDAYQF